MFLDTQCRTEPFKVAPADLVVFIVDRMPIPIGSFISRHVYEGKLKSVHKITSFGSCCLVDVANGVEQKMGNSWRVL